MQTKFQQAVHDTGELLKAHEIYTDAVIHDLWNNMRWVEHSIRHGETTAARDQRGSNTIHLYPALFNDPRAAQSILREFALYVQSKGGDRAIDIWSKKLDVPRDDHIGQFVRALKSDENRARCHTYKEILDTYPQKGHSVERLVAINLANALLANNIPYPDSVGVDIYSWGPTAEYANGKKYHSLIPLTSAYAPQDINNCFGCAFALLVVNNLGHVRDNSVAYAMKSIMRNVIKRASTSQ